MKPKISQTTTKKFINKLVQIQPEMKHLVQNEAVFLGQLNQTLSSFMEENYKEIIRICMSQEIALERIVARGMEIKSVIDVGASNGHVAEMLREMFFKDAYLLCMEGYEIWRKQLEQKKNTTKNFDFLISAVGDSTESIYFLENEERPTQGHAFNKKTDNRYKEVPQTTIDLEVESRGIEGPFMIKIDTHGREGEILNGAEKTLNQTELLMIEVNNFEDRGRMRFHELCAFLEYRGFRCADIAEPTWREKDKTFWQCDMFFIRNNRPEWSIRGY